MSKTVKNIIVGFTILCVIFLIVFSVELILINRERENGDGEPAMSGSQPAGNVNNGPATGENNTNQPAETQGQGNGEPVPPAGGAPPPPAGTLYERLMPDNMQLVFRVDGELFEHSDTEREDILDVFSYRGAGAAGLEMRFVFMPQGLSNYAENFLSANFNIEDSIVHGEEPIRRSQLRGVYISGGIGGTSYESWIYRFSGSELEDLGVMFIIYYQNETQRNALHTILDSLEMTPA